jgi:phosphoglycolate phosphatase-like HAD superfamily hydrolase
MKKAIIFDYDGVIVDSFPSVYQVYKKTCERFGVAYPETLEKFRRTYGYNYSECLTNLGIKKEDFAEASKIYKTEIVKIKHEIFPGIKDVIIKLSQKYKLYLVTASHIAEVLPKIKDFGLDGFFVNVYCGDGNSGRKAEMFLDLFQAEGYQPSEVTSIGDRAVDYDVAKKVGLADEDIILVTYGWGLDRSRIGRANIADHPEEILNFIN